NGTAGGNVNGGSPRGTTTDPVENMLMVLTDLSGQIIDFEFTDANGDFLFDLLDNMEYRLFGERFGKVSDIATFEVSSSNMNISGLDFEETETEILYQGTVSVETNAMATAKMYPNPVQNELRIKLMEATTVQVDILDLQGRVLESTSHNNTNEITFPMGHLNNGVYLIRLTDQEGNQQTSRVVKL
ncbi:MAG: T9SS type A sorting domain-containing protein, partial [Cryomorphaceae bacterium]|nr:T9SS type A sorting domain-containing protein [Cryomorphaceae bacterium]